MIICSLLLVTVCAAVCTAVPAPEEGTFPKGVSEYDIVSELRQRGVTDGLPKSDAPLDVFLGMYVLALTNVNVEDGCIEVTAYFSQRWTDPRLQFPYSKPFHDIEKVRMMPEHMWMPDIELYTPHRPGMLTLTTRHRVIVLYNGTVLHYPIVSIHSLCDLKSQMAQNGTKVQCPLKFGSWMYDSRHVDVKVNTRGLPILGNYKPSGQWTITDASGARNDIKYPCCTRRYIDVTFTLTLEKNEEESKEQ